MDINLIIKDAYLKTKEENTNTELKEWILLDELFKIEIQKNEYRFFKILIYLSKIENDKIELDYFIFLLSLLHITKEHAHYNQILEAYKNTYEL